MTLRLRRLAFLLMGSLGLLSAAAPRAEAALVQVDFTVANDWFGSGVPPFGLSADPVITGQAVFDNSQTGLAAFVSITFATGTASWSLADHAAAPLAPLVTFSGAGLPTLFEMSFARGGDTTYISSNNTFGVRSGVNTLACNDCVSFTAALVAVPEPASLAVFGGALLGLGAVIRRRRRRA